MGHPSIALILLNCIYVAKIQYNLDLELTIFEFGWQITITITFSATTLICDTCIVSHVIMIIYKEDAVTAYYSGKKFLIITHRCLKCQLKKRIYCMTMNPLMYDDNLHSLKTVWEDG
ncbi:hypothetical protein RIR_jg5528.t1 [Rhizophagus irregularis DAOM 181602=DAOM 197198]|uniref:Uncharacterized protein n=1 Tax=Rhizophagus irregularis (strain DAOM 181602 / DAOM 197198 / MUCL 43194) TaxID=747089 RepID=U9U4V0_RHIID|nr:hypothetical protein RIR_jg5528.t1 [Rhizophagus irregularis DAOM 181602=DAOM 197198]